MNRTNERRPRGRLYTLAVMLISLFCAVLVWLYALGYDSPDYEKKFSKIAVGITGTAELQDKTGCTVVSELSFSFDVTVSGKKTDVNSMRPEDISAYIDVSEVSEAGDALLPITVIVPNGIKVAAQSSTSAYVYIDEMVTKEVPVRAELSDYVINEGLTMGTPVVTPASVTVTGPRSVLQEIEEAYASANPGTVTGSFTVNSSVRLYDKSGNPVENGYVKLVDSAVNIEVPVYTVKSLPVKVYFIGGVFGTDSAIITLSDKEIKVRGTATSLSALDEIAVNIDETSLKTSSVIEKKIILPDGVENISGRDYVTVNITMNYLGTRKIPADRTAFELRNVPEGVDVSVLTQSLNITVMGPIDALRDYSSKFFTVVIDLDGLNLESGDNIFVPVTVEFKNEHGGIYVTGDYSVNISVN